MALIKFGTGIIFGTGHVFGEVAGKRQYALSLAALVAMWSRESADAIIPLLTITHPEMTDILRFALHATNIVSRRELFLAFPFDLQMPSDSPDRPSQGQLSISNIDRRMTAYLESISSPPLVTIEIIMLSTPDVVEITCAGLELRKIKYNQQAVTGDLESPRFINEGFPRGIVSPSYFPGAF
jgi:hypothetical protein